MADLVLDRGTNYTITVNYQKNGVAADLTGATLRFTVKQPNFDTDTADATAVIKKSVTSHTDPTHGISQVSILPVDSQTITPGLYHYDLKVQDASSNIYLLDLGTLTIVGTPTNRLV